MGFFPVVPLFFPAFFFPIKPLLAKSGDALESTRWANLEGQFTELLEINQFVLG